MVEKNKFQTTIWGGDCRTTRETNRSADRIHFMMASTSDDAARVPDHHRPALTIAIAALVLGVTGDLLLRWIPWGVNALLWTALFCVVARYCSRRVSWFPILCALLAAGGIAWRDSESLVALDIALLLLFLPMIALEARGVRVAAAGLMEIAAAISSPAHRPSSDSRS